MANNPGRDGPLGSDAEYSLRLLDGFDMSGGRGPVPLPPAAERVVAYLALSTRPCTRPRLAETLFIDVGRTRAASSMRSILHRIRKQAPGLLCSDGRRLALDRSAAIDVQQLDLAVERFVHPSGLDGATVPDIDALSGELLPDWDDEWVIGERERLRQRFLHALDVIGRHHLRHERWNESIETALRAVALEPLRESPRRLLVEAHRAEGNVAEAVREFDRFAALLHTELGLRPTEQMIALLPAEVRTRRRRRDG